MRGRPPPPARSPASGWRGLLLARLVGPGLQPKPLGDEAWLAAAAILILCLGVALWPALRPPAIRVVRIRRGRQAAAASAVAAGADVALVALALTGRARAAELFGGGGRDRRRSRHRRGTSARAGLALIPLRLLPVAGQGPGETRRHAQATRPCDGELGDQQSAPSGRAAPALLVILAVGTSTLALTQYQSWRQSVHDQAAFAAGAPVRIGLASAEPLSEVTQITRLRGVRAAMPVSLESLGTGQLLAIGGPQAAATVTMRRDLSAPVPMSHAVEVSRSAPGSAARPGSARHARAD